MTPNEYQALSQIGDGQSFIERMSSLQKDLQENSAKVTDEKLKELELILLDGMTCNSHKERARQTEGFEEERFMTPMDIALILEHSLLIQKLTEMTQESALSL